MIELSKLVIAGFLLSATVYAVEPPGQSHSRPELPPAVDPQLVLDNYNSAKCCKFVDNLEAFKLALRKKLEINLHESGNLLELSTGPSFAALIEIPLSKKKERYVVETNIIHLDKDLYVYFPYVALLNDKLKLIGTSDFTHSDYRGKNFFQPTGILNFSFNIAPNIDSKNEKSVRYLLIYTRKKHFTKATNEELKADSRNIKLKEVPVVFTGNVGDYLQTDTMHGLPGGRITVSNKSRFF